LLDHPGRFFLPSVGNDWIQVPKKRRILIADPFMSETLHFIEIHGYWLLFVVVLARQACLPVPANLAPLGAGALAGSGKLDLRAIVALSVLAV
jgi:membrane protein DedA with SNARE-associated domain